MRDLETDRRYDALRTAPAPADKPLDHFGRNPHGYDLGGDDGEGPDEDAPSDVDPDYGDGAPGQELVREALVVFAKLWQRFDVATAAAAFHMDPGLIAPLTILPPDYDGLAPNETAFGNCVQLISSSRCYSAPLPEAVDGDSTERTGTFIQPTVAEIAALLNVREQRVIEAVEAHYWMFLDGERDGSREIGHEGE